jgi:uncharacterized protein YndB with AHSA1/START domain
MRVAFEHQFPVPVERGFAYITDPRNWPEYWPGLVRIREGASPEWSAPGDTVHLDMRLLGRAVELTMRLERFERNERVEYRTTQPGLPNTVHERLFRGENGRFTYTLVVRYEPRAGLGGLFDRFVLPRVIRGALRRTVRNLEPVLADAE